jgi:excisionase family DNA binding protein
MKPSDSGTHERDNMRFEHAVKSGHRMLTVSEAANMLRVNPWTVMVLAQKGDLRPLKVNSRGAIRFATQDITDYIDDSD